MTPEEKRIKIAEICGWSHRTTDWGTYWWHEERNKSLPPGDDGFRECPDYLNDLNAMHEAEETMDDRHAFMCWFQEMGGAAPFLSFGAPDHVWRIAHATAAQRADAFLEVMLDDLA